MLAYCDTCKTHFDDERQKPECAGFGVKVATLNYHPTSHRFFKPESAITQHITDTRDAHSDAKRKRKRAANKGRGITKDRR